MDAGVDPALSAGRQHNLVHAELLGILGVEFGRLAVREGEIGRADIDRIDPGTSRISSMFSTAWRVSIIGMTRIPSFAVF
jgi:hypothetical protein